jgi:hypothetical protein
MSFLKELEQLLNRHSIDNDCNTPDFVLAEYLIDCLNAYRRAKHTSHKLYPSFAGASEEEISKDEKEAQPVIIRPKEDAQEKIKLIWKLLDEVNIKPPVAPWVVQDPVKFPPVIALYACYVKDFERGTTTTGADGCDYPTLKK